MEYGYSAWATKSPGGLGVKMAYPEREVYVSLVTALTDDGAGNRHIAAGALQAQYCLSIPRFSSIGGLSQSCGNDGMGTEYRFRGAGGKYDGDLLPVGLRSKRRQPGSLVVRARTGEDLRSALDCGAKHSEFGCGDRTAFDQRVSGYESWWDVPIAEVSERESVKAARPRIR